MPLLESLFLVLIPTAAILIVWLIINFRRDSRDERLVMRSLEWPETQGRVVSTGVVWGHVAVVYEYVARGEQHIGEYEISLTPQAADRYGVGASNFADEANEEIEDYPVGASVVIRYNPQRPNESVLYRSGEISASGGADVTPQE